VVTLVVVGEIMAKYRLLSKLHQKKDRIRFTAVQRNIAVQVIDHDVATNPIEGTIIALLAGVGTETAIRAIQALKHGETVSLGEHDAATLMDILEFHDLRG
jgi:ribosomal protein L2